MNFFRALVPWPALLILVAPAWRQNPAAEREDASSLAYDVTVDTLQPQPALSIRAPVRIAEIRSTIGQRTTRIYQRLQHVGVQPEGPPFTRYHGVDGDDVDLEVGFPVPKGTSGEENIESGQLPGGEVIRTVHRGPYEGLPRPGTRWTGGWPSTTARRAAPTGKCTG